MRVVRDTSNDAQRIDMLMAVPGATAAAVFGVDGVAYGAIGTYGTGSSIETWPGLQVFDVADPHHLVQVAGNDRFGFSINQMRAIEVDGVAYLVATSVSVTTGNNGAAVIDVSDPLNPVIYGGATDNNRNYRALLGAADFDSMWIDGKLYGLVASPRDDGVQVMDLTYLAER